MNKKIVFSTPYFEIEELSTEEARYHTPYYRLLENDAAICCLLDSNGNFLMVKQYRPVLGKDTLEFTSGAIEKDETPIAAAIREVNEEAGVNCDLLSLGRFHLMVNRTNINYHIFLGYNIVKSTHFIPEIDVEPVFVSRSTLQTLALSGEYLQLGGLGILQMASIKLNVDILNDPIDLVYDSIRRIKDREASNVKIT